MRFVRRRGKSANKRRPLTTANRSGSATWLLAFVFPKETRDIQITFEVARFPVDQKPSEDHRE
jgi:hypothetical protein